MNLSGSLGALVIAPAITSADASAPIPKEEFIRTCLIPNRRFRLCFAMSNFYALLRYKEFVTRTRFAPCEFLRGVPRNNPQSGIPPFGGLPSDEWTRPPFRSDYASSMTETTAIDHDIVSLRLNELEEQANNDAAHIDRLYEKFYDLWEIVNEMMEHQGVLFNSPLPLKYK